MEKPWTAVVLLATAAFMLVWLSFQPSPAVSMTSPASRSPRGEPQAPARRLAHHHLPRCTGFWETIWAKCRVFASTTLHWVRVLCLAETTASVPVLGPLLAGVAFLVWMLLWLLVVGLLGWGPAHFATLCLTGQEPSPTIYGNLGVYLVVIALCSVGPVFLLLLFPWPTLPFCNSAPCPCANGFCHAANYSCEGCIEGFHLSSGVCEENECSCKHGRAIARCRRDGQESCQSCSSEFQLLGELCVDSTCHEAVEGARPMTPIHHSEPSQADSPPLCITGELQWHMHHTQDLHPAIASKQPTEACRGFCQGIPSLRDAHPNHSLGLCQRRAVRYPDHLHHSHTQTLHAGGGGGYQLGRLRFGPPERAQQ